MNYTIPFACLILSSSILSTEKKSCLEYAQEALNLAYEYHKKNDLSQAQIWYMQSLAYNPNQYEPYLELGNISFSKEDYLQAGDYFIKALDGKPSDYSTLFKLGTSLLSVGQIAHAIEAYQEVLRKNPQAIQALYNIGYALKTAGQLDKAITIYRSILAQIPDYDAAHLALAHALMLQGDFEEAWDQHEWNLKRMRKNADSLRDLLKKVNLQGKIILFLPEGGLGDTLQFIRYAERFKKQGASTIVAVQKPLVPLLSLCPYIDHLLTIGSPMPSYNSSVTLMSLPAICKDTEKTFPCSIPYLYADQKLIRYWHERIAHDKNMKIGICWQSDVHNDSSRLPFARRGIHLAQLLQLSDIPNISWYCLQKKEGLDQLQDVSKNITLHAFDNFDEEHGSFMDTAALMHHMDLIITIDSAVAHLAGGLGKKVWLLLPYSTDWRWIYGRTDSPWYPTMHIFKQPAPFDWKSVIDQVHLELLAEQKHANKNL